MGMGRRQDSRLRAGSRGWLFGTRRAESGGRAAGGKAGSRLWRQRKSWLGRKQLLLTGMRLPCMCTHKTPLQHCSTPTLLL